jgi:hypothetical protein
MVGKSTLTETVIQRKAEGAPAASPASDGPGSPLAAPVLQRMESAFGADFGGVRVHEGPQAQSVGALAYTQGSDLHFAPGQYQPDSQAGQGLIGHELTHVVQQSQGRVAATTQHKGVAVNDDSSLEREADDLGARAAAGEQVMNLGASPSAGGGAPVQRRIDPSSSGPIQMLQDESVASGGGGGGTATTGTGGGGNSANPGGGSATVVGAAADTEYAFDNSFTPALVAALQANPNLSIDEVLEQLGAGSLGTGVDNDNGLHHPTIVQYGQTAQNTSECRDNKKLAVLIANQNYVNISSLNTPIAEAGTMKTELEGRGYDANVHSDKTAAEMSTLWSSMVSAAAQGDDLVAFYGGHGAPEGLVGVNYDFPPAVPDIFSNAQVAGVVGSATGKGAHIRFVMDSCHSGSAAQTVREVRENELAAVATSVGDHLRVAAMTGLRQAKERLLAHCHKRETTLQQLDDAIQQHQATPPDAANAQATQTWNAVLTALRASRTGVQNAFDRASDRMWAQYIPLLNIVKMAVGHKQAPPPIADYRTLCAQVNYLDDLWNSVSQPMERTTAEAGAQPAGAGATTAPR